ncbi:UNVERIFIED_CONTAM: hypothetical protein FKN15_021735, partial [Acipenser sinensis]
SRLSQGDVGGARTLQKKWTSFLKARLLCSLPERQVHFNKLQAVFTLGGDGGWQHTSFYAVFRAQWGDVDVSAVCQYHIDDIKKVFDGPYKEYHKAKLKNVTVVVGSDLVLPCQLISNLARPLWLFNDLQLVPGRGVRVESRLGALVIEGAGAGEAGRYTCLSQERGERFLAERYVVSVVASAPVFMEARAPDGSLGLVWVLVITLASACLLLLGSVLYLRRRLKQGKDSELMKPLESTLVYPVSLPREPTHFVRSKGSDSELWDTGNYYYSDGSLKIVPGHAPCPSAAPGSGIPGQPLPSTAALHSPNRLSLGSIMGSGSNGYIRLNLTSTGEERAEFSAPFTEELRKTLQQRSVLPDTNPEESSV